MRVKEPKKKAVYVTMVDAKNRKQTACTTVYDTTPEKAMERFKQSIASVSNRSTSPASAAKQIATTLQPSHG